MSNFSVRVNGECLVIPSRIYNGELRAAAVDELSPVEQAIVHCVYTRHHDGFTRQRHLTEVIGSELPWVVPYVVKLMGEYVMEILNTIQDRLDLATEAAPERIRYGRFVVENPEFFEATASRVASYWNCYYRFDFPIARPRDGRFPAYPGFVLIDSLRAAARNVRTVEPDGRVDARPD